MQGDFAAASPLLEESEKLCRTLSSTWELAYLLRKLAHLAIQKGELKRAVEYMQESLKLAQKLGDKSLIATTLSTLADIIGNRSTAALTFENQEDADEDLNCLAASKEITAAGLYKGERLFAHYPKKSPETNFPRVQEEGGVGSPCLQYTMPFASCPHASILFMLSFHLHHRSQA